LANAEFRDKPLSYSMNSANIFFVGKGGKEYNVLEWLRILGSIILVDLILSGDNALVIGVVVAGLQANQRWIALMIGGGGAILLRIVLTYSLTLLFQVIPYIEPIGGIALLLVTARLLAERDKHGEEAAGEQDAPRPGIGFLRLPRFLNNHRLLMGMLTILVADAATSLDNVVAIAVLAQNNTTLLIIGLLISIALLLAGGAFIAKIIDALPWVVLVASVVLAYASAQLLLLQNPLDLLQPVLHFSIPFIWWSSIVYVVTFCVFIIFTIVWFRNHPKVRAGIVKLVRRS
jgi:YjbE family integral membrane protein